MAVVLFVAIQTAAWRFAVGIAGPVTGAAECRLMRALERKIGVGMIELRLIELHDIGATSLVIGVTRFAVGFNELWIEPMQTAICLNVSSNLLMAIEAERFLRCVAQRRVAFGALFFVFGMGAGQLAGHHQCLQRCCGNTGP